MARKIVLLKTGATTGEVRSERGDYQDWFAAGLGWPVDQLCVVDAVAGDPFPTANSLDGLIISGSPLSVHERPEWSVAAGVWAAEAVAAGVPTLGVCYGHQLLGDALGGQVGPNPNGREMGTLEVELLDPDEPLFEGLTKTPTVILTHSDAVNQVPDGARIIARSDWTPVQAMAIGERTRTVQWHPEFDPEIIAAYIRQRAHLIDAEFTVGTAERWLRHVRQTDTGPRLLRNWAAYYLEA